MARPFFVMPSVSLPALPVAIPMVPIALVAIGAGAGVALAVGGATAALVGLAMLGCAFILRDFRVGVVLLAVLLPISGSALMPRALGGITGLNPVNLLLLATLAALLLRPPPGLDGRALLPRPLWLGYLLPIVIAGAIGSRHVGEIPGVFPENDLIEFTGAGGYLRDMLIKPLLLVVFAALAGAACIRKGGVELLVRAAAIAAATAAIATIGFVLVSGLSLGELASERGRERLSPLGLHANDLGRLHASAFALLLFSLASATTARLRAALTLALALVSLALLLTFSRAAWLGAALAGAWFLLVRRHAAAVIALALVLLIGPLLVPEALLHRLGAGFSPHTVTNWDAVSAGRIAGIWQPLLPELAAHPLFGNGLGAILWSTPMREGLMLRVTHPHNAWLGALLDLGLLGTLAVCAWFAFLWRRFRELAAAPALTGEVRGFFTGASVALAAFLLTGLAGSRLTPCLEQSFLWLATGMALGLQARSATPGVRP